MKDGGVHYARNGSVRLAYRVLGEGDTTLVWIPGWISNVDLWTDPSLPFVLFVEGLARGTRLVMWDKRGTGLSDPATHVPPLDERMDDLQAVMDAVGVDSAALSRRLRGRPDEHPVRGHLPGTCPVARAVRHHDPLQPRVAGSPMGLDSPSRPHAINEEIETDWGEGALADIFFGPIADVPGFREIYGRIQRAGASPTMCLMLWQALVEMRCGRRAELRSHADPCPGQRRRLGGADRRCKGHGRGDAERAIPRAAAWPPRALGRSSSRRQVVNFVRGKPVDDAGERVLSTILFTDIVSSTEQIVAQGDAQWRHQLDAHDKLVDWMLEKYGGRRVKHTGDGVFALFDGPTKAARCGLDLVPALAARGIRIRVGVHTGECERRGDEWSGLAVHVGRAHRRDGRCR